MFDNELDAKVFNSTEQNVAICARVSGATDIDGVNNNIRLSQLRHRFYVAMMQFDVQ
jgi:hypothetical protein